MTLTLAGSFRLKELRTDFDLIIIDEAEQSLEPEFHIPKVPTRKRSLLFRLHVVAYGNQKQLPAVSDEVLLAK